MFGAFTSEGRFFKGNLHGHSTRSDGQLSPARHCAFYLQAGYDFICLSDHFLDCYSFPITDTTVYRTDGFTTLLGAEIHAPALGNGELWHLVAVGLPPDFAPTPAEETGPQLAARALEAGAFVAMAHPEWYAQTLEDALSMPDGVHAVEVWNTGCVNLGCGGGAALLDQMLNAGRMAGVLATDDTHTFQREALGGWVMVKAPENSPEALLAALKRGDYYASSGPDLHYAEMDENALRVECSPVHSICLYGPGAVNTRVYGEDITRAQLPLERFKGNWARLQIEDKHGKRAWANPFLVP